MMLLVRWRREDQRWRRARSMRCCFARDEGAMGCLDNGVASSLLLIGFTALVTSTNRIKTVDTSPPQRPSKRPADRPNPTPTSSTTSACEDLVPTLNNPKQPLSSVPSPASPPPLPPFVVVPPVHHLVLPLLPSPQLHHHLHLSPKPVHQVQQVVHWSSFGCQTVDSFESFRLSLVKRAVKVGRGREVVLLRRARV